MTPVSPGQRRLDYSLIFVLIVLKAHLYQDELSVFNSDPILSH